MTITTDIVRDIQAYLDNDEFIRKNKNGKDIRISRHFEKHTKDLRDVKTVVREVKFADSFDCSDSLRSNLDVIIQKIKSGESMAQHISKNYKKSSVPDNMLYDWNINHLHLHVPHQGDLLFCIITDTVCHVIAIGVHGQWEDNDLYETAYRNWPELFLEPKGITPPNLTQEQRNVLRSRGINTVTGIDGKTVMPRALSGLTTSGHPLAARIKTMYDFKFLDGIKQNSEAWTEHAKAYIQKVLEINQINAIEIDAMLEIVVEEGGLSLYFLCATETGEKYRMLYDRREAVFPQ